MQQRLGFAIAIGSLILSVAAYLPSVAAFTPAVLFSFVAAVGAVVTAFQGFLRLGVVTLLVVAATVLISPIFGWSEFSRIDIVMAASAAGILVIGAILFWDFRRRSASA
jgi:hypothetical protein